MKNKVKKIKNLTGSKIRLFRKERGWTQSRLAISLQGMGTRITRCVIANVETQRCSITDLQLAAIAKVLRVPVKSLFPDGLCLADFKESSHPSIICGHNPSTMTEKPTGGCSAPVSGWK